LSLLNKQIRVTIGHFGHLFLRCVLCALAMSSAVSAQAQSKEQAGGRAIVQGSVRDSQGHPLTKATVFLQPATGTKDQAAATGSDGTYRFTALDAGTYTLRAALNGYVDATVGPVNLTETETKQIDLTLTSTPSAGTGERVKLGSQAPDFFDEPQFTVAGVTQATSSGGHGSDTVLRTTEALARATVSLSKDKDKESNTGSIPPASPAAESSLRDAVARNPLDPALHHALGDVEEKLNNPLEAVREYQRAAELDPSEPNLLDWGTELLTHRALEPATEVFTKGNHLFPKSSRMLVALGVAWYARGDYDHAAQCLVTASDLVPSNPTPYLFLGKMQRVLTFPTEGVVQRLARFVQLQPENALANYYYAVGLWKQLEAAADSSAETSGRIESLLLKAVQLDPKLAAAYLLVGVLHSRHGDLPHAISWYQKAIAFSPESDETGEEAHYRLAQAYQRTGDQIKAKQELELHDQLAKVRKAQTENERRSIQDFVISLQQRDSPAQPQP